MFFIINNIIITGDEIDRLGWFKVDFLLII